MSEALPALGINGCVFVRQSESGNATMFNKETECCECLLCCLFMEAPCL